MPLAPAPPARPDPRRLRDESHGLQWKSPGEPDPGSLLRASCRASEPGNPGFAPSPAARAASALRPADVRRPILRHTLRAALDPAFGRIRAPHPRNRLARERRSRPPPYAIA